MTESTAEPHDKKKPTTTETSNQTSEIFEGINDDTLETVYADIAEFGFPRIAAMAAGIPGNDWDSKVTKGEQLLEADKQGNSPEEKKLAANALRVARARAEFAKTQLKRLTKENLKGRTGTSVAWLLERALPKEFGEYAAQSGTANTLILALRAKGTEVRIELSGDGSAQLDVAARTNEGQLVTDGGGPTPVMPMLAAQSEKSGDVGSGVATEGDGGGQPSFVDVEGGGGTKGGV